MKKLQNKCIKKMHDLKKVEYLGFRINSIIQLNIKCLRDAEQFLKYKFRDLNRSQKRLFKHELEKVFAVANENIEKGISCNLKNKRSLI